MQRNNEKRFAFQHRQQRPYYRVQKQGSVNVHMYTVWIIAHDIQLAVDDSLW